MSLYNTRAHPIIKNDDTYFLDRKMITIHSDDRDMSKFPDANTFDIELPERLKNIQSMRLVSIDLPDKLPIFTNNYQNTKLSFDLGGDATLKTITIDEGNYTPVELAKMIETKMNSIDGVSDFECKYNTVTNKIWFKRSANFRLRFDIQNEYDDLCPNQAIMFNNQHNWGLPYYLGYKKQIYQAETGKSITFGHETTEFIAAVDYSVDCEKATNQIEGMTITGENVLYMELDKYNAIDETLYTKNKAIINTGRVNSAFAKIPLKISPYSQIYEAKHEYNPPIETMSRMRFKFRYHNQMLVDFKNKNFTFMIEINSLVNEQHRGTSVRMTNYF